MTYDALGRLKRRATQAQTYAVKHCSTLDPNGVNGPCYFSFPLSTGGTAGITFDADAERFTYDRAGNLTRANNQHALINRTYSPGGLLLTDTLRVRKLLYATSGSVVPAEDFTQHVYGIGYTYDISGRRSTLKFPDQLDPCAGYACPAQQYAYDSPGTGLLTGITDIRGQNFGFSYTDAGQLQYLTYPGNVQEQIVQYDAEGSPVVRHVTLAGSAWIADTVTYDAVGRPTQVRGKNLSSFGSQVLLNAYTGLGALAMQEWSNGGTVRLEQYWTDALATQYEVRRHNIRLAQSENNPAIRFSRYVGDGQVARDSSEIPPNNSYIDYTDYFYDFEGRTRHSYTRVNDYNAGTNDYAQSGSYYDGNGRLAQFERHLGDMQQASLGNDPRAIVESYRYDALGRRVLTHALRAGNCTAAGCESTVQRFVWDGDQLLYEVRARGDSGAYWNNMVEDDLLDSDGIYGAMKAYGRVGYTHAGGIDRPLGAVRGTIPFYPHTNARGLYEAATIDNGTVLTNDVAWPGKSASAYLGWTPRATPYEWFGSLVTEQADASGLMYRRNRYYDPKVGRFTQPDPIGIAGGLNSYGFASGDPVNYSDPFGWCAKDIKKEEVSKKCRDATPEEGQANLDAAKARMRQHQNNNTKYQSPPVDANTADCSSFCSAAGADASFGHIPYHTTRDLAGSKYYRLVDASDARAGDIMWQPGHMGIYTGELDSRGRPTGVQMGRGGARIGSWGPNGWFEGGEQLRYYRILIPR